MLNVLRADLSDKSTSERLLEPTHPGLVVLCRPLVLAAVFKKVPCDLVEQHDPLLRCLWKEASLPGLRLPLPVELDREGPGPTRSLWSMPR